MKTIAHHLTGQPDWTAPSRNSIHTALSTTTNYKRHTIERAIDELATEGYLEIQPQTPGKPNTVKLLKPYETNSLTDISGLLP
jgi:DNA-binding transcriptional MocR family regulator